MTEYKLQVESAESIMLSYSCLLVKTIIFLFAATISSFKVQTNRQIAYISHRAISDENTALSQEPFQSISSIGSDETLERSELEIVENFLIAEGSYLGSSKWKIQEVSNSATSWCYKCTPLGTIGKPVFLKRSRQDLADTNGWSKLRNEFEGESRYLFFTSNLSLFLTVTTLSILHFTI